MNNVDKNFVNDISQGLSRRFTFIDILPPEEKYFMTEAQNEKKIAQKRVIEKVETYGTEPINENYMQALDTIEEVIDIEKSMLEFVKKIRYTHVDDDSYLGLQIGTAQVIDIYENMYIAMIVSNVRNVELKDELIKDIVDSTLSSRIVPQLDGFDFNKLTLFYDAVQDNSMFSYMKRSKEALYKLIH